MAGRLEVPIGNSVFYVRKFEPFLSLEVMGDLQKHLLGPAASIIEADSPGGNDDAFTRAIEKVSSGLDGATLARLARRVISFNHVAVSIDGAEAVKLDDGKLNLALGEEGVAGLLELIVAIVRFNYDNFFTRALTLIGKARPGNLFGQQAGSEKT